MENFDKGLFVLLYKGGDDFIQIRVLKSLG